MSLRRRPSEESFENIPVCPARKAIATYFYEVIEGDSVEEIVGKAHLFLPESLQDGTESGRTNSILYGWAERDPEGAFMAALDTPRGLHAGHRAPLRFAEQDPEAALEILDAQPELSKGGIAAKGAALIFLLASNPEGFSNRIAGMDSQTLGTEVNALMQATRNPASLPMVYPQLLERLPREAWPEDFAGRAIANWATNQPEEAFVWLTGQPEGRDAEFLSQLVSKRHADTMIHPFEFLRAFGNVPGLDAAIVEQFETSVFSPSSPEELRMVSEALTNSEMRDAVIRLAHRRRRDQIHQPASRTSKMAPSPSATIRSWRRILRTRSS